MHEAIPYERIDPAVARPRPSPLVVWARAAFAVALLVGWWHAAGVTFTGSTSWEHAPYGGPFTMLAAARTADAVGVLLAPLVSIVVPAALWAWRGSWWAATTAATAAAFWFCLTLFAAVTASC